MPLLGRQCSTQPVHLYSRLQALSRLGSVLPQQGLNRAAYSSRKPIAKWVCRSHHLAAHPTLHNAKRSFSAPSHTSSSPDISRDSQTTRTMKDPIHNRPASPYANPSVQGPKHQILSSGTQQDLRKTMLSHTVNKTGLHPGGVAYVFSQPILTPSFRVPSCIGTPYLPMGTLC